MATDPGGTSSAKGREIMARVLSDPDFRAAVVGAGGYVGAELVGLLANHPNIEIAGLFASDHKGSSTAGQQFSDLYPRWRRQIDTVLHSLDLVRLQSVDAQIVFLATPHEAAHDAVPVLLERGLRVIDLSAAFRLKDAAVYPRWYDFEHKASAALAEAGYAEDPRLRGAGHKIASSISQFLRSPTAEKPFVKSGKVLALHPDSSRDPHLGTALGGEHHDLASSLTLLAELCRVQGRLDEAESKIMRRHPLIGHEILKGSASKYVGMGSLIALGHHEKYDGSGYPNGLVGDHVPLCARIVAVADVYDALTSVRPYKSAWTSELAFDYVRTQSGKHFDPRMVEAFLGARKEVVQIQHEWSDGRT